MSDSAGRGVSRSPKGLRLRFWQRVYRYAHRFEQWASDHEEEAFVRDEKYLATLPWAETVGPPPWYERIFLNGEKAVYDHEVGAFVVPKGATDV